MPQWMLVVLLGLASSRAWGESPPQENDSPVAATEQVNGDEPAGAVGCDILLKSPGIAPGGELGALDAILCDLLRNEPFMEKVKRHAHRTNRAELAAILARELGTTVEPHQEATYRLRRLMLKSLKEGGTTGRSSKKRAAKRPELDPWRLCEDRYGVASRFGFWRDANWVMCVDATGGPVRATFFPDKQYLNPLPHQRIQVRVHHPKGAEVDVFAAGNTGNFIPDIEYTESGDVDPKLLRDGGGTAESRTTVVVLPTFLPGEVEIEVDVATREGLDAVVALLMAEGDALEKHVEKWSGVAAHYEVGVEALEVQLEELGKELEEIEEAAGAIERPPDMWTEAREEAVRAIVGAMRDAQDLLGAVPDAPEPKERDAGGPNPAWEKAQKELRLGLGSATASLVALREEVEELTAALEDPPEPDSLRFPVTVEKTYTGIVRLGVALPMFGAASGRYEPFRAEDSDVYTVDASGTSQIDGELILGYTNYLERRPESAVGFSVAPTLAFGIADLETAKLTAFESVYLGVDLGWKNFSIAPTFVAREVTRLRDQYDVGDALTDPAASITEDRWGVGFGIVVYAPLALLKTDFGNGGD